MKKKNMIKSIATFAAVSAGVLFAGSQSASASTVKHTVVSGDTLNKLSAQYGVSVQTKFKILTKFMLVKYLLLVMMVKYLFQIKVLLLQHLHKLQLLKFQHQFNKLLQ